MPSNPNSSAVHVSQPLTNFSQKYLQSADQFVAMRAMPNLPVAKEFDKYYKFDRGDFYRDEAQVRADGSKSQGGAFNLSTDTYGCEVYSWHKLVTDRQRANSDPAVDLDRAAAEYTALKMLIKRERVFQDSFFKLGVWNTDVVGTTDYVKWSAATSTPIQNIRDGKQKVHLDTGYRPNKMVIGRQAWDTLVDNADILDRITGGATPNAPAQVMKTQVAQLFELDEILVMDAVYNTAQKGAAESNAFIGGDDALLYYAPESVGLETPSAGTQFSWNLYSGGATNSGVVTKRFRLDENEADKIEGSMAFDMKVTGAELGYFFSAIS